MNPYELREGAEKSDKGHERECTGRSTEYRVQRIQRAGYVVQRAKRQVNVNVNTKRYYHYEMVDWVLFAKHGEDKGKGKGDEEGDGMIGIDGMARLGSENTGIMMNVLRTTVPATVLVFYVARVPR